MNLRVFNQMVLGPGSMTFMIAGILFLCQPWVDVLHQWSVLVMLIGLVGFNVSVHIPPPAEAVIDDVDTLHGGPHG
jgi:hypothetical protein